MAEPTVRTEVEGAVAVITLQRPEARNAVDRATAAALADAFRRFDADASLAVAILAGAGGTFCAGADLKAIADPARALRLDAAGDGPMGPTRLLVSKPTIAAIEGYAVAGGLELALWCDLRVVARDAVLGVFSRRFGVPLIDGGTVRLARIVGQGRALDLVLTGRGVGAEEALAIGLASRVVEPGRALDEARALARELAAFPQGALRADRRSVHEQWGLPLADALAAEFRGGLEPVRSGETAAGAARFARGEGRHGA